MTAAVDAVLRQTAAVMDGDVGRANDEVICVGVDLGTAFTVIVVTDGTGWPLAGRHEFARRLWLTGSESDVEAAGAAATAALERVPGS